MHSLLSKHTLTFYSGPIYTCQDDHFPPTDSFIYVEIFESVLDDLYNSFKTNNIKKKQTETNPNCKYRKPKYTNLQLRNYYKLAPHWIIKYTHINTLIITPKIIIVPQHVNSLASKQKNSFGGI